MESSSEWWKADRVDFTLAEKVWKWREIPEKGALKSKGTGGSKEEIAGAITVREAASKESLELYQRPVEGEGLKEYLSGPLEEAQS